MDLKARMGFPAGPERFLGSDHPRPRHHCEPVDRVRMTGRPG